MSLSTWCYRETGEVLTDVCLRFSRQLLWKWMLRCCCVVTTWHLAEPWVTYNDPFWSWPFPNRGWRGRMHIHVNGWCAWDSDHFRSGTFAIFATEETENKNIGKVSAPMTTSRLTVLPQNVTCWDMYWIYVIVSSGWHNNEDKFCRI